MKKVNFIINSLKGGGTEKICCLLANELVNKGWLVNIYVFDVDGSNYYIYKDVNLTYLGKSSSIRSTPKIFKVLKNSPEEVFLVFNHELALVSLFCRLLLNNKCNLVSRVNNTLSVTMKFKKFTYRIVVSNLMKRFYRYVDFLIFQSEGIKEDMIENYNVRANYKIINNPVVIDCIDQSNITYDRNVKKILYVGRLVKQKNVTDLIYAFKDLIHLGVNAELDIVGEGTEFQNLKDLSISLGITEHIVFHGHSTDVSKFFKNADVTVLSSINEGFPNVLLESLAHGTPVVSYDCPSGPREIIVDNINGYLTNYLDRQDLAKKIHRALNKNWDRNEILLSIERFNVNTIVEEYESIIEQFI